MTKRSRGGDLAAPRAALHDHRAAQRREARAAARPRGSACASEPPDGAAVARGDVADVGQRRGQQPACARARRRCAPAPAGARARRRAARRRGLDAVEPGDAVEVDDHRGRGQPQVEQRHEALAAGQRPWRRQPCSASSAAASASVVGPLVVEAATGFTRGRQLPDARRRQRQRRRRRVAERVGDGVGDARPARSSCCPRPGPWRRAASAATATRTVPERTGGSSVAVGGR